MDSSQSMAAHKQTHPETQAALSEATGTVQNHAAQVDGTHKAGGSSAGFQTSLTAVHKATPCITPRMSAKKQDELHGGQGDAQSPHPEKQGS